MRAHGDFEPFRDESSLIFRPPLGNASGCPVGSATPCSQRRWCASETTEWTRTISLITSYCMPVIRVESPVTPRR
jgi:hypothetical protein